MAGHGVLPSRAPRDVGCTKADATRNDVQPSRANLALGLGIAALVANVLGIFITGDDGDSNGWIWILMALLAVGAVVVGLMDGRGKPRGRALAGTIIGGLILLEFLLFVTGVFSPRHRERPAAPRRPRSSSRPGTFHE